MCKRRQHCYIRSFSLQHNMKVPPINKGCLLCWLQRRLASSKSTPSTPPRRKPTANSSHILCLHEREVSVQDEKKTLQTQALGRLLWSIRLLTFLDHHHQLILHPCCCAVWQFSTKWNVTFWRSWILLKQRLIQPDINSLYSERCIVHLASKNYNDKLHIEL